MFLEVFKVFNSFHSFCKIVSHISCQRFFYIWQIFFFAKLSFSWASIIISSLPPSHPPGICSNGTWNVNQSIRIRLTQLKMEDNLTFFVNGRQPQLFCTWKTTSIFCEKKNTSPFFVNGKQPQLFCKGRRRFHFRKLKTTSTFCEWKTTSTFW